MPEDRGTIRQVAWTELFPWLDLLRVFRLAIQRGSCCCRLWLCC